MKSQVPEENLGTWLEGQWLRLHLPGQWVWVRSLVGELRAHMCVLSHVQLFATPLTVALQAPLSTESSGQEYWSGLPFPPPGNLPDPGSEPKTLASPALAGRLFTKCTHQGGPRSHTLCSQLKNQNKTLKKKKKHKQYCNKFNRDFTNGQH